MATRVSSRPGAAWVLSKGLHVSLVVEGRSRQYCAWKALTRLDLYADIFQVWIESAMELRHLRYFVTVAELGMASAARPALHRQPPLSAQIRQLEAEVGVSLLSRAGRAACATAAGETFLEDAGHPVAGAAGAQQAREARTRVSANARIRAGALDPAFSVAGTAAPARALGACQRRAWRCAR